MDGIKAYGLFVIRTALFPLLWFWAVSLARKHADTDPNGVRKVGAAMVVGVVLSAAVFLMLANFQVDSQAGMYDALDARLVKAVGQADYEDQISAIEAADGQLVVLTAKYDEAKANGEEENATVFQASIEDVTTARSEALLRRAALEPNHALYNTLKPIVANQDDERAKQLIASAPFEFKDMDANAARAFEIKDKAVEDMQKVMIWLLYPGVVGVFFAPMAFALGSILRNAWEPSESVGFKPYPGKSLGLFLLMGAFGVPALFFAAWGFWDMQMRSATGQISL